MSMVEYTVLDTVLDEYGEVHDEYTTSRDENRRVETSTDEFQTRSTSRRPRSRDLNSV